MAKAAKKATPKKSKAKKSSVDMEKFRLRTFVNELKKMGEVEEVKKNVPLSELSSRIEASEKAILFKSVGPERSELVANVAGSRRRMAAAYGVDDADVNAVVEEYQRRADSPQKVVYVSEKEAPVREVVWEGEDADLTKLPFHVQHEHDGSAYISAGIDFAIDPETGITNVGCRRLSLRGRHEAGTNVTAPSDLKRIYTGCVARGERLPVNFAIGCHPVDFMAAGMRIPVDEATLIGSMRGEPVPLVKGLTNDVPVPADAELVLEGYFGNEGYYEPEGPYGEYVGYYGPMHLDPVYHVTAITMRKDVLHQSVLHGSGPVISRMESSNMGGIRLEAQVRKVLKSIGVIVTGVHVPTAGGECQHIRVAIKQNRPGIARNVIAALFGAVHSAKHIFVVDDDIDVFDNHDMEWAMVSRFQADRDMVVQKGIMGMPLDPSRIGPPPGTKAGFDLTLPLGSRADLTKRPATAPVFSASPRYQTVRQALEAGPFYFKQVMELVGSQDGREIALELDGLRRNGELARLADGQYLLGSAESGRTDLPEGSGDDPNDGLLFTRNA
ncbi:MAG: UbiD family decarboxylase [Proteobacteria bacterium]|nr:UbiD family decarboxylase [Pseudomonadota bacterium]